MQSRRPVALASLEHSLDLMIELYVDWREACTAVVAAWENFKHAEVGLGDIAFRTYAAALDREEQVARRYQRAVEQVARAPAA